MPATAAIDNETLDHIVRTWETDVDALAANKPDAMLRLVHVCSRLSTGSRGVLCPWCAP